jgi:hypothetical protein
MPHYTTTQAKILNGATESGEIDLRGQMLLAVGIDAGFDGTTMSFLAAEKPTEDGGVYGVVNYLALDVATPFEVSSILADSLISIAGSLLPQGFGNCMAKLVVDSQTGTTVVTLYTRPL